MCWKYRCPPSIPWDIRIHVLYAHLTNIPGPRNNHPGSRDHILKETIVSFGYSVVPAASSAVPAKSPPGTDAVIVQLGCERTSAVQVSGLSSSMSRELPHIRVQNSRDITRSTVQPWLILVTSHGTLHTPMTHDVSQSHARGRNYFTCTALYLYTPIPDVYCLGEERAKTIRTPLRFGVGDASEVRRVSHVLLSFSNELNACHSLCQLLRPPPIALPSPALSPPLAQSTVQQTRP